MVALSSRSATQSAIEAGPAAAMDRVLREEHEARLAIAQCEQESAAAIERARAQRRALIERTQARIVNLRARVAQALERRSAEILERHRRASTLELEELADPGRRDAAVAQLAARLTTTTDAEPAA